MHDTVAPASHRRRVTVATASLVLGPALMSIGDLVHPAESTDPAEQATILVANASRWYAAHLLLLLGAAVFVPGALTLSRLAAERSQTNGDAARVLVMIGLAGLSAILATEMLVGRYAADGASTAAIADLLRTLQSGPVLGALGAVGAALFVGIGAFAIPFIREGGPWRLPSLFIALGAVLILVEIIAAEVVFSQIGNVMTAVGSSIVAGRLSPAGRLAGD